MGRWTKVALWTIGALLTGLGGCLYLANDAFERESRRVTAERLEAGRVTVTAALSKECDPERPIHVVIRNDSSKTLKKVSLDLQVFESGRSENLSNYTGFRTYDFILRPGESKDGCDVVPSSVTTRRGARYIVRPADVSPTFFEAGEYVPR